MVGQNRKLWRGDPKIIFLENFFCSGLFIRGKNDLEGGRDMGNQSIITDLHQIIPSPNLYYTPPPLLNQHAIE